MASDYPVWDIDVLVASYRNAPDWQKNIEEATQIYLFLWS